MNTLNHQSVDRRRHDAHTPRIPSEPASQNGAACGSPAATLAPSRPSGFALMLVLVALLILTTVSVAYLAAIRMRVRDQSIQQQGYIQMAVNSVLSDVKSALNTDYPKAGLTAKPEPYDYPWTKSASSLMPYTLAQPAGGTPASGLTLGDPNADDAWLASSHPGEVTAGVWAHVSNLKGAFLNVADADLTKKSNYTPGGPYVPNDIPSNNLESAIAARVLTPSTSGDARLVDTDGDGIGDALWFYPAINHIGTRRYVAAVYIEDLSAKLNVNTALPLRTGGAYAAADSATFHETMGQSSADVDLSAATITGASGMNLGLTDAKLANLVALRIPTSPAPNPSYGAVGSFDASKRFRYWAECGVRALGDGQPLSADDATLNRTSSPAGTRFGYSDEVELRWSGGLDRLTTTTKLEELLDLRSSASRTANKQEAYYTDAGATSIDNYFKTNPRRWLTCFSGECLEGKGMASANFSGTNGHRVNADFKTDWTNGWYLMKNAKSGGSSTAHPLFVGSAGVADAATSCAAPMGLQKMLGVAAPVQNGTAPGANLIQSDLLAANAIAAKGQPQPPYIKNELYRTETNQYPLRPLPVLTEAYLQCQMNDATANGHPKAGSNVYPQCNYGASGAVQARWGYVFEFSNPYQCPVKLNNVQWACGLLGWSYNTYSLTLDIPAGSWMDMDEDGDMVLLPGHKLLLCRNSESTWWSRGDVLGGVNNDANNNYIGTAVDAAVAAGGTDAYGRSKVHKVVSSTPLTLSSDASPPSGFIHVGVMAPTNQGAAPGYYFRDYHYLTLPSLYYGNTNVAEAVPAGYASPANGTALGFLQVDARTWGLSAGLDVLQCRPARQGKLKIDRTTLRTAPFDYTLPISLQPGATAADQGDVQLLYHRAMDGCVPPANKGVYDTTLLSKLGKDDKGVPFPAGRARIKDDTIYSVANDWYWGTTPTDPTPKAHYRHPGRMGSLSDMSQVVMLGMQGNVCNIPGNPASMRNVPANTGLATQDDYGVDTTAPHTGGGQYTDSDVAHWLYANLYDETAGGGAGALWPDVQALVNNGHSPLDILRLNPWVDSSFKPYESSAGPAPATSLSRNVPVGWLHELQWSMDFPGQTGGFDWTGQTPGYWPSPATKARWVDGNNDGKGLDVNANNYKDWSSEVDWNESMAWGRINLNTMPQWLMEEALPIKNAAIRRGVAQIIADHRAHANGYAMPAGVRAANDFGIAYLSELLPDILAKAKANNWDMNGDGVTDGKDQTLGGVLAAVGPLFQTCSTRSDYFVAHILVQGYDATDFSKGVLETARMMVILRRTSAGCSVVGAPFSY